MVQTAKAELRSHIRQLKASKSSNELSTVSELLAEKLFANSHYDTAKSIVLFASLPDEPDTSCVLEHALRARKNVWLPAVENEQCMTIRRYYGPDSLREGAFHIQEPTGEILTDYTSLDFILVPGVAFDIHGNRLGRGCGYYDRFLNQCPVSAWRLGYCYPFQLVKEVPIGPHDEPINEVIHL